MFFVMIFQMNSDVAARYAEKIKRYCDGLDPYSLIMDNAVLPLGVQLYDINNYFMHHHSSYSRETFIAYKSMDAYKWVIGGWVQEMGSYIVRQGSIVVAKVNISIHINNYNVYYIYQLKVKHSMRVKLPPLKPWVVIDKSGIVLCAHCTCMAGLGEVCSHVGAMLFALEMWNTKSKEVNEEV